VSLFGGGKSEPHQYSRAFKNIVQDENDVVGLLAYALYKRAIREEHEQGNCSAGDTRNPSRTVVETYRQAAERTLEGVINGSLEAARPELLYAAADAIETARLDLRNHVTSRTGFGQAMLVNIIAWGFTLFITVVILALARSSSADQMLSNVAAEVLGPANSN
jgi:hypothetical protein